MKCVLEPASRVWAYTRDSGGDDQDVGDQNRAVEAYCDENGLILERLFCDEARPGSSVGGREQFQEMMHLVRTLADEALPAGLVIWRFSRFARDFDDAQFYKAAVRRRGITIASIADEIPIEGVHGRLVEAVTDWHNALFLQDLSRDVRRGLHDLARQGFAPGGFPPVGYVREPVQIGTRRNGQPRVVSRWVPDPDKAPLVRRAWEMRAAGASLREIHEATGVLGAKGSYSSMFRNRTYLGILRCGDLEVQGAIEALITPEIWEAVQARTVRRPRKGARWPDDGSHPRRKSSSFLLSGLARCAYCGSAMTGSHANVRTRPNPWPFYLCGKKKRRGYQSCRGRALNARVVEAAVMEAVMGVVLTPAYVQDLIAAVNAELAEDLVGIDGRIAQTRQDLEAVGRAIANLLDLAETYGAQAAGERLVEREAERERLERDLNHLQLARARSRIEVAPEVIVDVLAAIREDLTHEDVQARRALLAQFVSTVELGNESGKLHYSFPLDALLPTRLWPVPPRHSEPKTCQLVWSTQSP